jgi:hypothetical protein
MGGGGVELGVLNVAALRLSVFYIDFLFHRYTQLGLRFAKHYHS